MLCGCDLVHLVVQRRLFQFLVQCLQRPVRFQISNELRQFQISERKYYSSRFREISEEESDGKDGERLVY